ncbi:MAG: winged helix-turn-helix transcriptional regulator [Chthoniobacterales bacterium]
MSTTCWSERVRGRPGRGGRVDFAGVVNRLLVEIGRSQRVAIVHELQRSQGLPVKELAARLGMSYMGIKQHCQDLAKDGYVDTWRNPKPVGRPEMVYRLTRKAEELFPTESNAMAIDFLATAKQLFGPTASGKILMIYFRRKTEGYFEKVKGEDVATRAKWFARVREREGCMATLESTERQLVIVERHSPIASLLEQYPETAKLERDLVEKVIGVPVKRETRTAGALYECRFVIG